MFGEVQHTLCNAPNTHQLLKLLCDWIRTVFFCFLTDHLNAIQSILHCNVCIFCEYYVNIRLEKK